MKFRTHFHQCIRLNLFLLLQSFLLLLQCLNPFTDTLQIKLLRFQTHAAVLDI